MENNLTNVESIIKELKCKVKGIDTMTKYDGITIICTKKYRYSFSNIQEQLNDICKELNLLPISLEQNEDDKSEFALQFPELKVEYTEDQITKMYKDNFKWLFDNVRSKKTEVIPGKQLLMESINVFVKQAISIYCRSNINPYKENIQDYLENVKYRADIEKLFYEYLIQYCTENNIN